MIALGNATYVPMSVLARRMLEVLDERGLVPAASIQVSAALIDAAQRFAALLSD